MKPMNLKKVVYIMYGFFAAFLVLLMLGLVLKSILVILLGCLCAVVGIVFGVAKLRCPHCGEGIRAWGKYCSHCGHHLVDFE